MIPITRRRFLIQSGATVAGTLLASSLAEQLLAATNTPRAAAMPTDAFPGHLVDELATLVADLERKYPYASALFASQSGVSVSRDRNGKRVSESGFPSLGVTLRVFDGSEFHESAV